MDECPPPLPPAERMRTRRRTAIRTARRRRLPTFLLKRSGGAGPTTPPRAAAKNKGAEQDAEEKGKARAIKGTPVAEVGYIPGRGFVGRVLECGWDVGEEVVRKGEWVVGLLDVRKVSGAGFDFEARRGDLRLLAPA